MTVDLIWISNNFPKLSNIVPLARGGQKIVYTANHELHQSVVLKVIRLDQDRSRTEREIAAVQQINSLRVPRILEYGRAPDGAGDEHQWIIEARVEGKNVAEILRSGPFGVERTIRLGLHVLEALSEAQKCQIVHRDVKPANVIMDGSENFWLLDFGIARHLKMESLTPTMALGGLGTLGYAPPEQYRNQKRDIDVRADLFALGVTLYQCLHGSNPFLEGARDGLEVVRRIEGSPLPVLATPNAPGLPEFIATLTKRRTDHRPGSVEETLIWLREIEGNRVKS